MKDVAKVFEKNIIKIFDVDKLEHYKQLVKAHEKIESRWRACKETKESFTKAAFYDIVDDVYKAVRDDLGDYRRQVEDTPIYAYNNLKARIINSLAVKLASPSVEWYKDISLFQLNIITEVIGSLILILLNEFENISVFGVIKRKDI